MEIFNINAERAIGVIFYQVSHRLLEFKRDFNKAELIEDITKQVFDTISENPKAFDYHDIDSEAFIRLKTLGKYGIYN